MKPLFLVDNHREGYLRRLVRRGRKGSTIQYYRGYLYADRQLSETLDLLAKDVYQLYEEGRVTLVQKRHGEYDYSYYAILT